MRADKVTLSDEVWLAERCDHLRQVNPGRGTRELIAGEEVDARRSTTEVNYQPCVCSCLN